MLAVLCAAASLAAPAAGRILLAGVPPAIGPYPAQVGALPNGTVVTIGGMKYETVHLPQAEPTLSPERWRNYQPVMSPTEYYAQFTEPTTPPERDCVRSPGQGGCSCKDMINACAEESYSCEVSLQTLSKAAPHSQKINYISKFNHPLLNTLMLRSRLRRRSGVKQPISSCGTCFRKMVDEKHYDIGQRVYPSPQEVAEKNGDTEDDMSRSLLQQEKGPDMGSNILAGSLNNGGGMLGGSKKKGGKAPDWFAKGRYGYTPSTFGWRIDAAAPNGLSDQSIDASFKIGGCTLQEVTGLQECLTYFWGCDQNRNRLMQMVNQLDSESEWIDSHPGTRPGIYSGTD